MTPGSLSFLKLFALLLPLIVAPLLRIIENSTRLLEFVDLRSAT